MFNGTLRPDIPTLGLIAKVAKDPVDDLVVHVEAISGLEKTANEVNLSKDVGRYLSSVFPFGFNISH